MGRHGRITGLNVQALTCMRRDNVTDRVLLSTSSLNNMASSVFVQSFTHLKDRLRADQALPLLQRVASLVKPIMRQHNWILPTLGEFFPDSDNLVGEYTGLDTPLLILSCRPKYVWRLDVDHAHDCPDINAGQKILLRLRPAWAPDTFYDEEQLVAVMLHEVFSCKIIIMLTDLSDDIIAHT